MATEEETIEQAAAARKERLRALREAQELLHTPDEGDVEVDTEADDANTNDGSVNGMKFRNYVPQDKVLHDAKLAPAVISKFEDPIAVAPRDDKEDPFLNIAPKKPNWDLRKDVQKRLDKLEKRTLKAMYKLAEQQDKEKLQDGMETVAVEDPNNS